MRGIDFNLVVGGTISGTVYDESNGFPLSGVEVSVDRFEGGAHVDDRTNVEGVFNLRGLAPGSYQVWINAQERGYVGEYYDDRLSWDDADLVAMFRTDHVTGVDFGLARGATISGIVIDGDTGLPIPDMEVRAELDGYHLSWSVTDKDGIYTLLGVPDGGIDVVVWGQGYLEQRKSITVRGAADYTLDF